MTLFLSASEAYDVFGPLLLVTLTSGMVIGAQRPGISFFEAATPPTLGFGILGYVAVKRKPHWFGAPWIVWHIVGQGGSYIGVVTAFGFQVVPRLIDPTPLVITALWALPTIVGSTLIARTKRRWAARYEPVDRRRASVETSSA